MMSVTAVRQNVSPPQEIGYVDECCFFAHAFLLMDELAAIATIAKKRMLRFIPLKGAAGIITGENVRFALPMNDVDLLVQEADYPEWCTLMNEQGYQPLPHSDTSFVKDGAVPLIFDFHTRLRFLSPRLLAIAWETTCRHSIDGMDYELLQPEIDLLYRSLHITVTHGYINFKWLNDLEMLINRVSGQFDWIAFIRYARECRAAAPAAAVLRFLGERSSTPVPKQVVSELRTNSSPVVTRLFLHTLHHDGGIPFFDYIAPLLLGSPGTVFATLWRKLFPPLQFMKQRYSTTSTLQAIVIYPIRLLLLAVKGIYAAVTSLILFLIPRGR